MEQIEKKRISDVGLLLYFNNYDQIKKIDSKELGELIKKEMEWQLGLSNEPEFEDVRCDCFHSTLKAEIKVRDKNADRRNKYRRPKQVEEQPQVSTYTETKTEVEQQPIVEKPVEDLTPPTAKTPLNECINYLMNVYEEKGYDAMTAKINYNRIGWGYSFDELKSKCDAKIEESMVYG